MDYSALAAQFGGTTENPGDYSAIAQRFGGTPVQADPQIGKPQDLTFAEKYVGPLIDAAWRGVTGQPGLDQVAGGNLRGSVVGGAMQGAADPGVKLVQLAANALPQSRSLGSLVTGQDDSIGGRVNQAVKSEEQQYQNARKEAGRGGWDVSRALGNAAITAPVGAIGGAPSTLLGLIAKGAGQGAVTGALQPVTNGGEHFWRDTAKDAGIGLITGGVVGGALGSAARMVSPNASVNPEVAMLRDEGVNPTVGQTLGGWANALEEKAQSIPILGDAIAAARKGAVKDFNTAAINRSQAPIGEAVQGSGQAAIAKAGNNLSAAYNSALGDVSHVNFDTPEFNQALGQLQQMSQGLAPNLADKFDKTVANTVLRKMSPNGSILGSDLKAVDSELGQIASRYQGSAIASEQEFGDAVRQLQANVMDQVKRTYPQLADKLNAADAGWANLVRVERAGASAVNSGGVFTPAQLGNAVKASDRSVRDRATSRGEALMQELASAGQNVLGNKIADSGTVGRALMAGGAMATAAASPAIPLALMGGAAAYSRPVQNALVAMIAKRPAMAPEVANYLRRLAAPATLAAVPVATSDR